MRTLMLIASVAMIASGIFCVANSSAAFLAVAFIIGVVLLLIGAIEIIIGWRADFERNEMGVGLTKDGVRSCIIGLAILTGQVTDDAVAIMLFGLYLTFEGVFAFRTSWLNIAHVSRDQRTGMAISAVSLFLGIYMLFNSSVFNFPVLMLIGIALIVMGLNKFIESFTIEYIRPGFITGNEERLREAEEEEKRALAKAKEGIREQKIAQRRIRKIKEDIDAEQVLMMEAQTRKKEREAEAQMEQEAETN